jgi:phage shock protein PspC (stress-responsive transcriptional regulator)
METTIKTPRIAGSLIGATSTVKKPTTFWEVMEFSRFGIISMAVAILGIIGGFAASYGAHDNLIELAAVAFPTIIALSMILAVTPMKVIFYVSSLALLLDIAVLVL